MASDLLTRSLSRFFGIGYILPVGRGSLGIYAVLRAWGGSSSVALQATVCHDVVAAVLMAGRQPFFCDVDPETGLTNAAEWLRAREAGAGAAIVVHLYGNPANTAAAREAFIGALVIDDAAQALGASTVDGLAGTGGDVGLVSFGHTKQIEVGGAALICRDFALAKSCNEVLADISTASVEDARRVEANFRAGYQSARKRLIQCGDIRGFAGLLEGYAPSLLVAWCPDWGLRITDELQDYPAKLAVRRDKALRWRNAITNTGLVPVGMGSGSAPWRFSCRLPGCSWERQNRLGEILRSRGLHVSHWYLPANWLVDSIPVRLPGAEQLAREVFQFWLNEETGLDVIEQAGPLLQECFQSET